MPRTPQCFPVDPKPPAPRHEPVDAAGKPEHDQRIDQEQRERREKDRAAQILRLGGAEIIEPRIERPVIDRHYRLEDVIEATRYVETEQKVGNVVLTVSHA